MEVPGRRVHTWRAKQARGSLRCPESTAAGRTRATGTCVPVSVCPPPEGHGGVQDKGSSNLGQSRDEGWSGILLPAETGAAQCRLTT